VVDTPLTIVPGRGSALGSRAGTRSAYPSASSQSRYQTAQPTRPFCQRASLPNIACDTAISMLRSAHHCRKASHITTDLTRRLSAGPVPWNLGGWCRRRELHDRGTHLWLRLLWARWHPPTLGRCHRALLT